MGEASEGLQAACELVGIDEIATDGSQVDQADEAKESRPNAPIISQEIKPTNATFPDAQSLADPSKRAEDQGKSG
jgi:hypothetical protein